MTGIRSRAVLLCAMLVQAAATFLCSLTRHNSFKSSAYDVGDAVQALFNLLHGNGLTVTIAPPFVEQSWLAVHFTPILYLVAPLYALFPHAETLLALYSFAIALAAWPLFHAVKRVGLNEGEALAFALLYLVSPFVLNAGIWDFHEVAFAPFFIASALWALLSHRRNYFLLNCLLLMLVKEHYGLAVSGMGVLWARQHHERTFGFSVAAMGAIVFAVVIFWLMPYLNPLHRHFMMGGMGGPTNRFGWLVDGGNMLHLLPYLAIADAWYLFQLCLHWLLLPLLSPLWLLAGLADFSANLLSMNGLMRSPFSYHSAALAPVLAVAAAQVFIRRFSATRVKILRRMVCVGLIFAVPFLALPGLSNIWELNSPQLRLAPDDAAALADIHALIPPGDSVAAQSNVGAHMAARAQLYHFPESGIDTRWLVLRFGFPFASGNTVFGSPYSVSPQLYFAAVRKMLDNRGWTIAYFRHGWLVMKQDPHGAETPGLRDAAMHALASTEAEVRQ